MARSLAVICVVALSVLPTSAAPGGGTQTRVTVWGAPPAAFGGATYGFVALSGAMISEQREVDVATAGEVRIAGIAATADPASIQLRDLTEPAIAITEQRFVPGAATPTEILARHIGDPVTVVTAKGDVAGVLRAADDSVIVVEIGAGDQKRLSVMRRDGFVHDVRLPLGAGDKPSMVWRVASKRPGKHSVELTYRADGLSWTADYLAVLDEAGKAIDFSAWATVKNATGASFDRAELTLISGAAAAAANTSATTFARPPPTPLRFTMPNPIKLAAGDSVQVELVPARVGAKVRPVVTFEAMQDPAAGYQEYPGADCTENNGSGMGTGRAELAVELDVPSQTALPDGRVRLFRKKSERLEMVSEEQLRSGAGLARVRLAPDAEITGERKAVTCTVDERAHTIREKVEVRVENKGKQASDVVVREFIWRWPVWRMESEDHKGAQVAPQTQEYRVRVPAHGTQVVTYSVLYTW